VYQRALSWLAGNTTPFEASPFGAYELEVLNEIGLTTPTLEASANLVSATLQDASAPLARLVSALRILAARKEEYWFGERLAKLVGKDVATTAAASLAARLDARAQSADSATYAREVASSFGELGFAWGEPAALARILGALAESDALSDATAATLTRRLLERTGGSLARSTFETAEIVFSARALLAREAQRTRAAGTRHVVARTPGDGPSLALAPIPGGFAGTLRFDTPMPVERVTRVTIDGVRPEEIQFASLAALVPYEGLQPIANGLAVERSLLRIGPAGAEPIDAAAVLHRGDLVVSRVVVRRTGQPLGHRSTVTPPSNFVVLQDAVPAVAETIDEDRPYLADAHLQGDEPSYWGRVKETLRYPDRTERVVELRSGSFTALQVWRVAFGGRVVLPPARAFDMYDDEIAGNTTAAAVVVE
jgi:hypothetical protein